MAIYNIRFDTESTPGYAKITTVEIKTEYIKIVGPKDHEGMKYTYIDENKLSNDPLYLHLLAYVTANNK